MLRTVGVTIWRLLAHFAKGGHGLGATGFEEPTNLPGSPELARKSDIALHGYTVIDPHFLRTLDPRLSQVVANWSGLPDVLKNVIQEIAAYGASS